MASSLRIASVKAALCFVLVAAVLVWSADFNPAAAKGTLMDEALSLLTQAQNTTDEAHRSELLQHALRCLNSAHNSRKEAASAAVQSAIAALQRHDAGEVTKDIAQAMAAIGSPGTPAPTATASSGAATPFGTSASAPASSTALDRGASTLKLTGDQARAIVLIKGDNSVGTGFLVQTREGPAVITNIHVISNNPNLQFTTSTGEALTVLSYKGADDRDLAMIAVKEGNFHYLIMANDVSGTVQPGDEVITPGNSEGGEVMLNTDGKVLGIGPDRVEIDNPLYHGNSGGPVFDVKTGQVIGVVSEAVTLTFTDTVDKASFASRNSAIARDTRYFGLRLDNVPDWLPIDSRRLLNETAFLDSFDQRSRALDCYLNAPNDNKPEDIVWKQDAKIVEANRGFFDQAGGADASQTMDAERVLYSQLSDIARLAMSDIQNPDNFYPFDRQRAKSEAAYRKALLTELEDVNSDVSRLGSLARANK